MKKGFSPFCYLREKGGLFQIIMEKVIGIADSDHKYLSTNVYGGPPWSRLCVFQGQHPLVLEADRSPALREPTFQGLPLQRDGDGRGGELGQFQERF